MIKTVRKISKPLNGLGAFLRPCKRIDFYYCNWGGSSEGMKEFLSRKLEVFAKENGDIEFHVIHRPNQHPSIKSYYVNGRNEEFITRKFSASDILEQALQCSESDGLKPRFVKQPVESLNPSVRGVWNPFSEFAKPPTVIQKGLYKKRKTKSSHEI
ncbi:ribosomal protein subunit L51 [Schizosaccharomyces japonicus yFS275]|uniref:Large ribosomal subunit protein mL43 n=1 Tax=Schizosaccharomyces japonicus (strain yFS275 / FY16936) TaxID=402676 RepID=B6K0B0_SCHJY|nr:ribosomal protein subunit L51 [Schizosaccharomyces japonicus yFS275]EEB06260.2 ribosomal protein subunit L51 [Schizosaccharomyces japonicus yFS275]